jgi:hypothetical protein
MSQWFGVSDCVTLTFGLKELDSTGDDSRVVFEDIHDVVFGDPVGGVEEVQNLCRRRDSVFRGGLRVSEAIVSVAHEVLERGGRVDEVEGLLHVVEEGLLRVTQLHLMAKECHVIQCTDTALDRHRVSHLNHSTALFALQEFHLKLWIILSENHGFLDSIWMTTDSNNISE